jgi:glutathione reductase (NADPH)
VPQAPQLHWSRFIENKNKEIERLNGIYNGILTRAGVEIIRGKGTFVDAHTVSVVGEEGEKRVTAKTILIAVGGWPFVPDIPGKELVSMRGSFPLVSLARLEHSGGHIVSHACAYTCVYTYVYIHVEKTDGQTDR